MRNSSLNLGALVCCLLILSGSTLAQQKAGEVSRALQPASVHRAGGAKAAAATGTAAKALTTITATDHLPLFWNDVMETGKGGRMRVVLGDGSILSVASQSKLMVTEHSERSQRSTFNLEYGKVRAQVVHMSRPDSKFEVRTATAVCGVLGTDEFIDATLTSTLVVNLSDPNSGSQIIVRSSDSNIGGSVVLNPGEATRVDQGKPPTKPAPATASEVSDALGSTALASNPEVALVLQTGDASISAGPNAAPQVQLNAGNQLTVDGRTSSGGSFPITSYGWSIPKRNFQSSEPVIELDTTSWNPGSYEGTLTITTANNATATGRFVVLVKPPTPGNNGSPSETLEGLRQAYETLQLRQFMGYFSPDYSGYSALEATLTGSFANIASNRVFLRKANGSVNGDEAIYQTDFEIRFLPKTSALPQSGVPSTGTFVGAPRYSPAGRNRPSAAAATGSISGDAGAVDTFITLVGLTNGIRQVVSTGTATSFSFTNLPAGQYEITPARNGFAFSPAARVVDVAAGPVAGVTFTARGIEEVITESVTVTLHRVNGTWLITSLSAPIGSAGLVGIPGVGQPAQGSTVPTNFGGDEVAVPHFDVAAQGAPGSVARGGTSGPVTITVVPKDGFFGSVTINLNLPTGISAFVNGSAAATSFSVPVSGGVPATSTLTFAANNSAGLGVNTVAFNATSGALNKQGTLATFNVYQVAIAPPVDGLNIFAGGISRTMGFTITTAPDVTTPLTVTLSGDGLAANAATVNGNGVAILTVSSAGNATGPVNATVTATGPGVAASLPIVIDRKPPFTLEAPANLALVAGQSSSYTVHLTLFAFLKGPVIVNAPSVSGFTFAPASVTMGASGDATFTITSNSAGNAAGIFTAAVPGFSSTVSVAFTTVAAVDFKLADATLNVVAGQSGTAAIVVQQLSGSPAQIVVTAGSFDTSKISVSGGGTLTGSGSVSFAVQALSGASGTVTFTVTGAVGSLTRAATVTVNITAFDFALSASPVSIVQGASAQVPITVQETGGPAPVTISVGGVDGARLTVTGGGTLPGAGSVALSVAALASAPAGGTSFTVTGVSGAITHTITVQVTITVPFDFSMAGSTVSLEAGTSGNAGVQVNQLAGAPAAIAIAISGVDTSKITVSGGSSQVTGTATLSYSISVAANAPAGPTSFTVTGQAGGLTRSATVTVNIAQPKLTVTASPSSLTLTRGATTSVTINVSIGTLSATVAPGPLPAGISSVTPTTPTTFTSPGSATFNVVSDPASAAASATLAFTVSSAAGTTVLNVPVSFTAAFSLNAQIAGGAPAQIATGGLGTQMVAQLTVVNGFSGTVTITATAPSGLNVFIPIVAGRTTVMSSRKTGPAFAASGSASITLTGSGQVTFAVTADGGVTPGTYTIHFQATSGANVVNTSVDVAVQPAFTVAVPASLSLPASTTSQLAAQVAYHPNYSGSVTVAVPTLPALLASAVVQGGNGNSTSLSGSGTVTFDLTASSTAGTGSVGVSVADVLGNSQTANVPLTVTAPPAFTVSVAADTGQPTTIAAGGQGTILVVSVSGGSGTINVSAPTLSGWTFTATTPTSITGSGTVKFAAKAAPATTPGNYQITFSAAGATTQTSAISLTVHTAFTMSGPAGSLTLAPAGTGNLQLTIAFDPNYTGTVTVTPPAATGPVASFTPSTAQTQSASGAMNFGVTGSLTAGTSTYTFNASDGTGNTASATVTIVVSGGAGNGVINAGTASGAAGGTAQVPIDLALAANVAVDTVQFGATVTLSGTAVPVTLTFTADPGSPFGAPSLVNNQTAGRIAVFFQLPSGAAGPFTGSTRLGVINIPLTSATSGQSYAVTIVSANASLGSSSSIPLTPGSGGTVTISSGRMAVMSAAGPAVSIDNASVTYTPAMPKPGDVVRFRVRVNNSGREDVRDSELLLISGSRVLARQRFDVRAGRSEGVEMEWKSEEAPDLRLAVVPQTGVAAAPAKASSVPLRGFAIDRAGAASGRGAVRRDRLTLQVKNESCAGVRVAAMSNSRCGGSVDLEVQPVIAMGQGIQVQAGAPNGGISPLGVVPLPSVSAAPAAGYQPQALLEAGHSYALKTRGGYAIFRVARIASSVNPRLLAGGAPQQQRRSRPGASGDVLGQVFDQQTDDRLLDAARITIDIEWLIRDDGSANFR